MTKYKLTFYGKGGHGAEPHEAIDTTIICSEFVRKISIYPNVEIHSIKSGDAFNVISGKAELIIESNNKELLDRQASAILIYYGKKTSYTLEEM